MTAKTRHVKARASITIRRTTDKSQGTSGSWRGRGLLKIRDVSLFVDIMGPPIPVSVSCQEARRWITG